MLMYIKKRKLMIYSTFPGQKFRTTLYFGFKSSQFINYEKINNFNIESEIQTTTKDQ